MPRNVLLPNGKRVACLSAEEALSIYHEIAEYFDHGIEVKPGSVIVDVGANIGLFTQLALERCGGEAHIYAFEPIPATFGVLEHNTRTLPGVRLFRQGLSDRAGTLEFTYYPNASAMSTAYPEYDLREERERALFWLEANPVFAGRRWLKQLPKPFLNLIFTVSTRMVRRGTRVSCPVTTLSEFMRVQGLERIDLLKVDAEKAEGHILEGIKPEDWGRICQIVLEVHDVHETLKRVLEKLEETGFSVTTEYLYGSPESGSATLYARKKPIADSA